MKAHTSVILAVGLAIALVASVIIAGASSDSAPSASTTAGERIYATGTDSTGRQIQFTDGPDWLRQKNGGCAACHGANGQGGPVPNSGGYAPTIEYKALISEGYTDEKIERAITKGEDASGQSFSSTMPRWDLSDQQLTDLITYIKTLSAPSAPDPEKLNAEGRGIYLTGITPSGVRITSSGGPAWFEANRGGCAACHGKNGRGGTVRDCLRHAPNIQYAALKAKHYTDSKIARATTDGINAAGSKLNDFMPRWQMNADQLKALIAYLRTLKG